MASAPFGLLAGDEPLSATPDSRFELATAGGPRSDRVRFTDEDDPITGDSGRDVAVELFVRTDRR